MTTETEEFEFRLRLERERKLPTFSGSGNASVQEDAPFETGAKREGGYSGAELVAGAAPTRFALGAAEPFLGVGQAIANSPIMAPGNALISAATGEDFNIGRNVNEHLAQLEQMKRSGMEAYGQEGMDVAGGFGMLGSPAFTKAAQVIKPWKNVKDVATYPRKVAQGGAIGGGAAVSTPVTEGDYEAQKQSQVEGGIGIGALIPGVGVPIWKAGKIAYHLAEPMFNKMAIKGRALLDTAGDRADDIIALLRQKKELVPGSKPTAGEAAAPAGSAEFSSLQKQAEGIVPSKYVARADEQNAARLAQVRTVGKDANALAKAEAKRRGTGEVLYGLARKEQIQSDVELKTLLGRPSMDKALGRAGQIAKEKNESFIVGKDAPAQEVPSLIQLESGAPASITTIPATSAKFPVGSLHNVKMAMDDMIENPDLFGIGASEVRAIGETRKLFINWLERKSGAYKKARITYAAQSKPINQMEVGQELEKRLIPALSQEGKQRAASYAQAIEDAPRTIKRATGQSRFNKLEEVLEPEALRAVESVKADLERGGRFEHLASKGQGAALNLREIAGESMKKEMGGAPPTLLHRTMMLINHLMRRASGKLSGEMAKELALEMLHPEKVAETMMQARFRQKSMEAVDKQLQKFFVRATAAGAIGGNKTVESVTK